MPLAIPGIRELLALLELVSPATPALRATLASPAILELGRPEILALPAILESLATLEQVSLATQVTPALKETRALPEPESLVIPVLRVIPVLPATLEQAQPEIPETLVLRVTLGLPERA